jgi:hypothetical protein
MNTSNLEASVLINGPFDNYGQIFAWTNIDYTYYNENNFKDDEQRKFLQIRTFFIYRKHSL